MFYDLFGTWQLLSEFHFYEKMRRKLQLHRKVPFEILCLTFKISLFTMQPVTYVVSVVKLTGAQPTLKLSTDY